MQHKSPLKIIFLLCALCVFVGNLSAQIGKRFPSEKKIIKDLCTNAHKLYTKLISTKLSGKMDEVHRYDVLYGEIRSYYIKNIEILFPRIMSVTPTVALANTSPDTTSNTYNSFRRFAIKLIRNEMRQTPEERRMRKKSLKVNIYKMGGKNPGKLGKTRKTREKTTKKSIEKFSFLFSARSYFFPYLFHSQAKASIIRCHRRGKKRGLKEEKSERRRKNKKKEERTLQAIDLIALFQISSLVPR